MRVLSVFFAVMVALGAVEESPVFSATHPSLRMLRDEWTRSASLSRQTQNHWLEARLQAFPAIAIIGHLNKKLDPTTRRLLAAWMVAWAFDQADAQEIIGEPSQFSLGFIAQNADRTREMARKYGAKPIDDFVAAWLDTDELRARYQRGWAVNAEHGGPFPLPTHLRNLTSASKAFLIGQAEAERELVSMLVESRILNLGYPLEILAACPSSANTRDSLEDFMIMSIASDIFALSVRSDQSLMSDSFHVIARGRAPHLLSQLSRLSDQHATKLREYYTAQKIMNAQQLRSYRAVCDRLFATGNPCAPSATTSTVR